MNCVVHRGQTAVGFCGDCSAGLCDVCYDYTVGHLCYDCLYSRMKSRESFYKKYNGSVMGWGIALAIILALASFSDPAAFAELGLGAFAPILLAGWGFLAGYSFGGALYANKGEGQSLVQKVVMFFLSLALAPIYFFIRLADVNKAKKSYLTVSETVRDYPKH